MGLRFRISVRVSKSLIVDPKPRLYKYQCNREPLTSLSPFFSKTSTHPNHPDCLEPPSVALRVQLDITRYLEHFVVEIVRSIFGQVYNELLSVSGLLRKPLVLEYSRKIVSNKKPMSTNYLGNIDCSSSESYILGPLGFGLTRKVLTSCPRQ